MVVVRAISLFWFILRLIVCQILNSVCDWFAQDKSVRCRRPTGWRTPPIWRLRPWCSIPRPLISTKKSDLRYVSISLHLYLSNITNDEFNFLTGATKPWALFGPWNLRNLKASQMELDFWTAFIGGPLIKILHMDETAVNCLKCPDYLWTGSFTVIPYELNHLQWFPMNRPILITRKLTNAFRFFTG